MGVFFIPGEQKIRPGVYQRYENRGLPPTAGADDGKCSAVFRSNWGPVGRPIAIENFADITRLYGDGGVSGTTAVAKEQFRGGASRVFALRLGDESGTPGTLTLSDTEKVSAVQITMLHPGSRPFSVTVRPTLTDPNLSELLLLDGTAVLERFRFPNEPASGQAAALIAAVNAAGSNFFSIIKKAESSNALETIDQTSITPGTDPVVNVAAYSAAFEALEAFRWNVLAVDTNDPAVHLLMQMYIERIFQGGKFVKGVIGEDKAVPFDERLTNASAYNDYKIVYVGTGFIDLAGTVYEGWLAAARIAGMIAGTPSNESITHLAVTGATELTEPLSNFDYERSIQAGMLTFSTSSANTVWVESGINTLVLPGSNEDDGWKKIKRVKVRFELFQRINDTVERLVGRINNDSDGQMTVIQSGNAVCNEMTAERKLLPGAHLELDPDNPPKGDSAWFLVFADDIDALEKMYFVYKFRFAPETEAA